MDLYGFILWFKRILWARSCSFANSYVISQHKMHNIYALLWIEALFSIGVIIHYSGASKESEYTHSWNGGGEYDIVRESQNVGKKQRKKMSSSIWRQYFIIGVA